MDLDLKKKGNNSENCLKKYLYDKNDYGWKVSFKDFLYKSGKCGENGIFMGLKKHVRKHTFFYQDLLSVWMKTVEHLEYECKNIYQVLDQPVFLNPKIKLENVIKLFMMAGLKQIEDYAYEYVPVFLPSIGKLGRNPGRVG